MLWAQTTRHGLPPARAGRIILGVKRWGLSTWLLAAGLGLQGEPRLGVLLQGMPPWIQGPLP